MRADQPIERSRSGAKDANGPDDTLGAKAGTLGAEQTAWLKQELRESTATWKVIANDLPLGLVVPDGAVNQEGVAQGDNGAPLGREGEFAAILAAAKKHRVTNLAFVTADVHYTAGRSRAKGTRGAGRSRQNRHRLLVSAVTCGHEMAMRWPSVLRRHEQDHNGDMTPSSIEKQRCVKYAAQRLVCHRT